MARLGAILSPLTHFALLFAIWASALPNPCLAQSCTQNSAGTGQEEGALSFLRTKVEAFEEWLRNSGVPIGTDKVPLKITVTLSIGGAHGNKTRPELGMVASRAIQPGEDIAFFPAQSMVHAARLPSPYKPGAKEDPDAAVWHEFSKLAAWILREKAKGKESEWAAYIDTLPEFVPLSVFYNEESLKLMEDEDAVAQLNGYNQGIGAEYVKCDPSRTANASLDEFKWAQSLVMSRCFGSFPELARDPDNAAGAALDILGSFKFLGPPVLIPLADLANHDDFRNWVRYSPNIEYPTAHEKGGFVFRATREVKEGEEILGAYGWHTNEHWLHGYGFLPEKNEHDVVQLSDSVDGVVDLFELHGMEEGFEWPKEGKTAKKIVEKAHVAVGNCLEALKDSILTRISARREESDTAERREEHMLLRRVEKVTQQDLGMLMWQGGQLSPELLTAFAALWFRFRIPKQQRANTGEDKFHWAAVANASVSYGWSLVGAPSSCMELLNHAQLGPSHQEALLSGADAIADVIKERLARSSSSSEEDKACLASVRSCELGSGPNNGPCPEVHKHLADGIPKAEVETALRYRVLRKQVFHDVVHRLKESCSVASTI